MTRNFFDWRAAALFAAIISIPSIAPFAAENDDSLPRVKVVATDPVALEGASSGAFTVGLHLSISSNLTVNYVLSGTASNGVDYVLLANHITIPAGILASNITVQPLTDPRTEKDKKVILTLLTNAAYRLESRKSATVTIIDHEFNNRPPSVHLTTPTNGTVFIPPANITIQADASDTDDAVGYVSFYANDHFLGSVTNTPYSLIWSNAPPGRHALFARAVDVLGESTLSEAVHVTVTNSPPHVSLVSPTNGTVLKVPANITLEAQASDSDDAVRSVMFFSDNRFLGSVTNSPYIMIWSNAPSGEHRIMARATDLFGQSTSSSSVRITISNTPPVVSLVQPTNGAAFKMPANVLLLAQATDSDGTISKVSFLNNGRIIGSVTNSPYSLIWSNAPPGNNTLSAQATDAFGAKASSKSIRITVSK